ncbi:choline/ethanolamine kinase family protein [Legionella brunensis]|uniref:Choline kinase n=1 Tax=Legionella brunensis TaxID=29422 RepID=A0A0W0SUD9_9GAMM|nr:choline/ethanolamine kinase family protein [Legionella brunensis]KTC86884.1 choline kinase [Legionella brunensis]
MKESFFGSGKVIPKRVCIYILSLTSLDDLNRFRLVNKTWKDVAEKTKVNMSLMPAIQRVPLLAPYTLAQLGISPMSGGMTNCTFKIKLKKQTKWVLRVPGEGSSAFINRDDEAYNAKQAAELELNVAIDFFDPKDGLQLTRYLENNKPLNKVLAKEPVILQTVATLLKALHRSPLFRNEINIFSRNSKLLEILKKKAPSILPDDVDVIEQMMIKIGQVVSCYKIPLSPCHNDTTLSNFLVSKKSQKEAMNLLDWEYSANNDKLIDLVYFLREFNPSEELTQLFIKSYFGTYSEAIRAWFELYKPVVGWWYAIWSWTQISNNANSCEMSAYKELASISYKDTKECLETEAFKDALSLIESETHHSEFTKTRSFEFSY